jgi:Cdc6-like AAA superfamily ATPase
MPCERQQLDGLLLQAPSAITVTTVFLSPRDSGKTALLQNYPLQAEEEQQLERAYAYINCRRTPVTTPANMAIA